jgi:hypothetical protein
MLQFVHTDEFTFPERAQDVREPKLRAGRPEPRYTTMIQPTLDRSNSTTGNQPLCAIPPPQSAATGLSRNLRYQFREHHGLRRPARIVIPWSFRRRTNCLPHVTDFVGNSKDPALVGIADAVRMPEQCV